MPKSNILLTAVGGDIGQSVIQCLQDTTYSDRLYGCDIDKYAAGQSMVKGFATVPSLADQDAYKKCITKLVEDYQLGIILPLSEREITFFAAEKEYFKSLGVNVLTHDLNTLNILLDKLGTIDLLNAESIMVPQTIPLSKYSGEFSFPLYLKARKGHGGKQALKINDQAEFDYYAKKYPDWLVQEMIGHPDEEYTVGVFFDGQTVNSIAFKRKLGYGSMTKFAQLVNDPELTNLVEKIARIVNSVGSINIQLRKDSRGYFVFEINPRLSSTVYFRHHFGFQDAKWWLDLVQGKKIVYQPKFKSGIGIRTVGSVFFEMEQE